MFVFSEWHRTITWFWRRNGSQTGKGIIDVVSWRNIPTSTIDLRTDDLPTDIVRHGAEMGILRILETGELSTEREQHIACSTLTMLGYDNLSHAMKVVSLLVDKDVIILRTMNEQDS